MYAGRASIRAASSLEHDPCHGRWRSGNALEIKLARLGSSDTVNYFNGHRFR
jgi:hypothetical protein